MEEMRIKRTREMRAMEKGKETDKRRGECVRKSMESIPPRVSRHFRVVATEVSGSTAPHLVDTRYPMHIEHEGEGPSPTRPPCDPSTMISCPARVCACKFPYRDGTC